FRIYFPMAGFNTVVGFNIVYRVAFGTVFQDTNRTRLTIRPVARYAFSRDALSGYLNVSLRNDHHRLEVNGGRYVSQLNDENPILPVVNTFSTLFLEKNLMKIFERDFVELKYSHNISPFMAIRSDLSWSDRRELLNQSDFKLIDRKRIEGYTGNRPLNETLAYTGFPTHQALTGSVGVSVRPWLKFRVRNGHKREIESSSPTLTLDYAGGFGDVASSDVRFDLVELGIKHELKLGVKGTVDF